MYLAVLLCKLRRYIDKSMISFYHLSKKLLLSKVHHSRQKSHHVTQSRHEILQQYNR